MSKEEVVEFWKRWYFGETNFVMPKIAEARIKEHLDKNTQSYKADLLKELEGKYDKDSHPDYIYGIKTAIELIKQT